MIFRPLPALIFCESKTSSPPTSSPLGGLAGLGRPHLLTYSLRTVPKERPLGGWLLATLKEEEEEAIG